MKIAQAVDTIFAGHPPEQTAAIRSELTRAATSDPALGRQVRAGARHIAQDRAALNAAEQAAAATSARASAVSGASRICASHVGAVAVGVAAIAGAAYLLRHHAQKRAAWASRVEGDRSTAPANPGRT